MSRRLALCALALGTLTCSERPGAPGLSRPLLEALDAPGMIVSGTTRGEVGKFSFSADGESFRYGERTDKAGEEPAFEARIDARNGDVRVKRHDAASGISLYRKTGPLTFREGLVRDGRAVFPVEGRPAAAVFTARPEGLKEDLVLAAPIADRLELSWELHLDEGLEARIDRRGDVRVYGVEGYLRGGLRADDADGRERVERARRSARKGTVLYRLPAPTVRDAKGVEHRDVARFELRGTSLSLIAERLERLAYPVSIDPSVIITTTAELALGGNEEGGVEIANDMVTRGEPRMWPGTWSSQTPLPTGRHGHASVIYNGYLYLLGGKVGGGLSNDVTYAKIDPDGALGSWQVNASRFAKPRYRHASVAYNGYLYVIGGLSSTTGTTEGDIQFAPIHADGTIGNWTTDQGFSPGFHGHSTVAHKGFLYIVGGHGPYLRSADVRVLPFKADGGLGSPSGVYGKLPSARYGHASAVYNGNLYVVGGDAGGYLGDVLVAPIGDDGSVGAFVAGPNPVYGRSGHTLHASNGLLFSVGGNDGSKDLVDVMAARIAPDGSVERFHSVSSIPRARSLHSAAVTRNRIYLVGGLSGGKDLADVDLAPLEHNAGVRLSVNATGLASKLTGHSATVVGSHLYVVGGTDSAGATADVRAGRLDADGSVGALSSMASLPSARFRHATVSANGHLYVLGGEATGYPQGTSEVAAAAIASDGSLAQWKRLSPLPTTLTRHSAVAAQGRVFVIGGLGPSGARSEVHSAEAVPDGSLGTWRAEASLPFGMVGSSAVVYADTVYLSGFTDSAGAYSKDVYMAPIQAGGILGAWTIAGGFSAPSYGHKMCAYDGYLYAVGGTSFSRSIVAAPILASGRIDAFRTVADLAYSRTLHAVAANNGFLYVIGGTDGTTSFNYIVMAALPGSSSVGGWSANTKLPAPVAQHAVCAYNGYVYSVGGMGAGSTLSEVRVASVGAAGALDSWTPVTRLVKARRNLSCVAHGGFLYAIGGTNGTTISGEVFKAPIQSSGALGLWSSEISLPVARELHSSVASDGYLYVIGGQGAGGVFDSVLVAVVKSDGTIGAWTTASSKVSPGRLNHGSVIHDGNLYVVGGENAAQKPLSEVRVASIGALGIPGFFRYATPLPKGGSPARIAAANGRLYVFSGFGGLPVTDMLVAPFYSNGKLGDWTFGPAVPGSRSDFGVVVHGGYIYLVGGSLVGAQSEQVHSAPLRTFEARGVYSKLVDLGPLPVKSIDSVRLEGDQRHGAVALEYRTAGFSGQFGSIVDLGEVPLETVIPISGQNLRYVWLELTLDDTRTVAANDDANNGRKVYNIELSYSTGGACYDAVQNGTETDVDCGGGTCQPCASGKKCQWSTDCISRICASKVCMGGCSNGVKDGSETDVDCGGGCPQCGVGKACAQPLDCAEQWCDAGKCKARSCSDLVKNGTETDVDCGGSCGPCQDRKGCVSAGDCQSLVCSAGRCVSPSCTDRVKNGTETDLDCGGICPACADGSRCAIGSDCASKQCLASKCAACNCTPSACEQTSTCDGKGGCVPTHKIDGASCSDGALCTRGDACAAGVCKGTPYTCTPNSCQTQSFCDGSGCNTTPKPDEVPCNDGNACTTGDYCYQGQCYGTVPTTCSASDECHHVGVCDPTTGICSNPPREDGFGCGGGTCQKGVCVRGADAGTAAADAASMSADAAPMSADAAPISTDAASITDVDAGAPVSEDAGLKALADPVSFYSCLGCGASGVAPALPLFLALSLLAGTGRAGRSRRTGGRRSAP